MLISRRAYLRVTQLILAAAAITLTGVYLLKIATPYGLGLVNDSAAYIGGAEAIVVGRGFTRTTAYGVDVPILHFPPAFSVLLAGVYAMGVEPLVGARLIGLLLFAVGTILFGLLCRLLTDSWAAALFGGGLFATWETGLRVYSFALSEPLFLAWVMLSFLAIGLYFRSRKRGWLVLSALAAAAASLTRYTGLVVLVAEGLSLLLFARRRQDLAKDLVVHLGLGGAPFVIWMLRNWQLGGSFTNRSVVWHPISLADIHAGIGPIIPWVLPLRLVSNQAVSLFLSLLSWTLLLGLGLWVAEPLVRRGRLEPRRPLAWCLAVFSLVYLAGLAMSISLFDASTPLDMRLLSPALVSLLALVVTALTRLQAGSGRLRGATAGGLAAVLLILSVHQATATVGELEVGGQGFASLGWQNSRALEELRALPGDVTIYANRQSAVLLLAGRSSFVAPTPIDPATTLPRPDYATDLAQMRERLLTGEAVLALFHTSDLDDPADRSWLLDLTEGIPILAEFNDATIYGRLQK